MPFDRAAEPLPDNGSRRFTVPHTFVRCATEGPWPEEAVVTALRTDPRWRFVEIPVNHLGIFYAPDVVAGALLDVVSG